MPSLSDFPNIIIMLIIIGMFTAAGLLIMDKFDEQLDEDTAADNATEEVVEAIAEIPGWLGIIIIIVIAVVMISYLYFFKSPGRA